MDIAMYMAIAQVQATSMYIWTQPLKYIFPFLFENPPKDKSKWLPGYQD